MTVLPINYNRRTGTLTASINDMLEVGYNTIHNTLTVTRSGQHIRTTKVRENYPARAFIEYCYGIAAGEN
jgi:hypothetical protein